MENHLAMSVDLDSSAAGDDVTSLEEPCALVRDDDSSLEQEDEVDQQCIPEEGEIEFIPPQW